jgi:hypothetical protein
MATRAVLLPLASEPPPTGAAEVRRTPSIGRPIVAYDAAIGEGARWTFLATQGLTAPYTLRVLGIMASATSGTVVLGAAIEAVTPADALDLDAGESFDAVNSQVSGAVPGTAGYLFLTTITLTNADSIAAGDYVRLEILRDATHASDTAAGDFYLLAAELRDAV